MARLHRRPEEARERSETRAPGPRAEERPRERNRVKDGRRQPARLDPLDGLVEERQVEARVVRDDHAVPGEREEAAHGRLDGRRAAQVGVADPGQLRDHRSERRARPDERLERPGRLEPAQADGADLADLGRAGGEPGRLEIDDDEGGRLERKILRGRAGERDVCAGPDEPRVGLDHLPEQRARQPGRSARKREQRPRGIGGGHGPAPFLDELDQPIRGIQAHLHACSMTERMFVQPLRLTTETALRRPPMIGGRGVVTD